MRLLKDLLLMPREADYSLQRGNNRRELILEKHIFNPLYGK